VEKPLRQLGLGDQLDQFALSLNRAAEGAAPTVKDIFWNALKEMTFQDAISIFRGNDTAINYIYRTTLLKKESLGGSFFMSGLCQNMLKR